MVVRASQTVLRIPSPAGAGDRGGARLQTRRRRLQLVLGLLWLVDAALQYQPFMFTRDFVTQIIEPGASAAPALIARPALWSAHFMITHIAVYNALFATIQLVIALAILYRPLVRAGLVLSVAWSLGIWVMAEGMGGITSGASPLAGAPGAAALYAAAAVLLWPHRHDTGPATGGSDSVAGSGVLGRWIPWVGWAVLWLALAALSLAPDNRSPDGLHDAVTGVAAGEPRWIQSFDGDLASPLLHRGTAVSVVLAILFTVVAVGVCAARLRRPALVLAVTVAAVLWLGQDFGGVFTGSATDVNTGPMLILLAAIYWPLRPTTVARV